MVFGFFLVVMTIIGAVHGYLWLRLVKNTTRQSSRARRIGTIAIGVAATLLFATLIGSQVLPRSAQGFVAWPGFIWLAVMFYLVVTLLTLEIPALAARVIITRLAKRGQDGQDAQDGQDGQDAQDAQDADASRRLFLARTVAATAGLASTAAVGTGMVSALGTPQRRRVSISLAKLPKELDGFRIALLSDLHLGPILGTRHTQRVVTILNGYQADVIAVVGDLVDGTVDDLSEATAPLRHLRSRLGAYFVSGNHEGYSGEEAWIEHFWSLGLRPLRNDLVHLNGIDLAGVNDAHSAAGPDYDKALAGRDPNVPVVLLAHQPIQAHEAAKRGVDLQLSGHTHDGQMWPFSLLVGLVQPVRAGLGTVDGMPVYVTRGAGFWGPPVRFGAPPDVTLIKLRSR
ncbi:MAG: metallophosphoesterase [Micromonosporaceae bacterium]|nr:metallophosphoesterase [Micromonosporaceae bacterium]